MNRYLSTTALVVGSPTGNGKAAPYRRSLSASAGGLAAALVLTATLLGGCSDLSGAGAERVAPYMYANAAPPSSVQRQAARPLGQHQAPAADPYPDIRYDGPD